jgi:FtsP/CotA-like multicopper oxidase with cupredoxin domain/sugar lactone lactonase YvrE
MNARKTLFKVPLLSALAAGAIFNSALANQLYRVTNVSPYPALTNEFYITATNTIVNINGTNVHVLVYKDDPPVGVGAPGQIPGPMIEATVGQTIICHFKNKLTNNIEGASIHWHGIELDNDSDGTAITQDAIFNGQTYTYKFIVTRAGLFWYHSHMLPGTTTLGGMYGPIIVHDTNETALISAGILPTTNYTFQLMMSDISFTNGFVGKVFNGTNYSLNTLIQLCENNVLGLPNGNGAMCAAAGPPGDVFLCNGSVPKRNGSFCAPTASSTPLFFIGKNQRIRLQLFDASISRNCYLSLKYPCTNPSGNTNLYHIGGQGGLLDYAVLDGGVQSGYNFQYGSGMVNIGSGMREDVMFYSSGNDGDVIQLLGYSPGGSWKLSAFGTNYPVAFFVITNGGSSGPVLTAGSPILNAVGATNENLRVMNTNSVAPPPVASYGNNSGYIEFKNNIASNGSVAGPNIGDYAATALDGNSGYGSWPTVPHPPSAVWVRAGDVVQLAIANNTGTDGGGSSAVHPYHLHGFAMQPVAIYSADLQTNLFTYPFNEFFDTMDILPGEALVFRIKLSDRPKLADTATGGPLTTGADGPTGGNIGRWLMHCHIFLHATIGMISELVVIPNSATRLVGPLPGTNSVMLTHSGSWTATPSNSWLHLPPGNSSGSGSATVLFTYDANPGATRTGTLTIGGMTVTVTQAGTKYVKAPGPVTTLATGLSGPTGMAADSDGNVYFCDGGHGALKRWNPASNTVTTLASGYGNLQGLALDGVGNVYFADFGSTAIRKWSASTHTVSTVFNNSSTGVSGLAVDAAGNVYITVPNDPSIKKWTAATGTLTSYTTNGLNAPYGVAVDANGGVYAADTSDDEIKVLGFKIVIILGHPIFVANWNTYVSSAYLNSPWNLAVDDGANIYIADGFHNAIKKFNYASNTVDTLFSTGLSDPTDVAVDPSGNVYLSDFNNNAIKELPYAFVDPTPRSVTAESGQYKLPTILMPDENLLAPFVPVSGAFWIGYNSSANGVISYGISANLGGPRSSTLTVLGQPITINQAGTSAGVAIPGLVVGPAAGSNTITEFVIPSIALWSASTATPWLHLPFTSGAGSGNVLFSYDKNVGATRTGTLTINAKTVTVTQAGSTYVQVPSPITSLVSSGLASPSELTVDGSGNVIFSDTGHNAVKMWSPAGNTVTPLITSGLFNPEGVAVDPAGNIYLADFSNGDIKERLSSDSSVIALVDDSPNAPASVSLDLATNVFWSGPTDDAVKKRSAVDGTVSTIISSGLNGPYGIALDVGGNIYIADTSNNAIKKWTFATASVSTIASGGLINTPWGLAVDGSGNIYVANGGANSIVEWVAASNSLVIVSPAGALSDPTGVGIDAFQNVYVADFGHAAIKELPRAFVDPTPKAEPATAGTDTLPIVLPAVENLQPPFAPVPDQSWLHVTSAAGGVVGFSYDANPTTLPRSGNIILLGQAVPVSQAGAVFPPYVIGAKMTGPGAFQFGFTNGTRDATYSVLFTTNLMIPLTNWTVIGTASQVGPDLWQFTDTSASNAQRFYSIRSP